jgi:hypothetical protein
MTHKKLSALFAATLAVGAITAAVSQTASADKATTKDGLKEKPPVVQICDTGAYQNCLASANPPFGPPTIAFCKAMSGCSKEVN